MAQTSLVECRQYLLNTLLRNADAMSMGHGIEVRPMMLHHRLVMHALALPPHLLARPKTGFTLPLSGWLHNELRPRLQAALDGKTARAVFTEAFLAECKGRIDDPGNHRTLWSMLVLVSWMDFHGIAVAA